MKRYLSAAVAAAALFTVTGCEGRTDPPTQVSTSDPSAGITSNYTSQSLQADISTSSTVEKTIETVITEAVTVETENVTALSTSAASTSAENNASVTTSGSNAPTKATTSTKASSNGGPSADTSSSSSVSGSSVATTTTSATTSQQSETTTRPAPDKDEIIEAYKNEVSKKINSMIDDGSDNISVDYTLYDMDKNGIPELIIIWWSPADAYQVTFYTYDEHGTKVISDGTLGENIGFAGIRSDNEFYLTFTDSNKAELYLMDYDDLNQPMEPQITFEYDSENTFESQLEKYGVEQLPFVKYTYSGEELTYIYHMEGDRLEYNEIAGRDFSFIDDYEF